VSEAPTSYSLVVREVVRETADACSVSFELPAGADGEFAYLPGQFLTVQIPTAGGPVARCYSLCSSPHLGEPHRIAVKRVRDGVGSNWICDNLAPGDVLECLPPAGTFTPKSLDEDLLLFAGGSGITPVLSILRSALAAGTGHVTLVYANQSEGSVIFAGLLRELAQKHPDRLHVIHWLETLQGLPTREQLKAFAAPFAERHAFICGPSPFMDSVSHSLRELGVPPARIHVEKFRSLEENPFDAPADVPVDVEGVATTSLQVELDGETHCFDWPRTVKLLDFLLDRGVKAPYSCRQGLCSACACVVTEGEVEMETNEILESDDLAEGFRLACQSRPATEVVKIKY
jgi:3-ketosteroid 9alpha-monooxygenase subunit B